MIGTRVDRLIAFDAVHDAAFVSSPGEGSLVLFEVDGHALPGQVLELLGDFLFRGELEVLGLDGSGTAGFAGRLPVTGQDDFTLVGLENIAGIGQRIELARLRSVTEYP